MLLLVRPLPLAHESKQGYVLRLSSLNGFDHPRWCVSLGRAGDVTGGKRASLGEITGHPDGTLAILRGPIYGLGALNTHDRGNVASRYWNTRFQRYCPTCLAEQRYHRAVWGVTFGVACDKHAVWLRDDCHGCRRIIRWTNAPLGKCSCGTLLETATAVPCTDYARSYAALLASALHLGASVRQALPSHAPVLNVEELLRLTWFLGAYAVRQTAKAQKISGVMQLENAIAMVQATCEVLFDWPGGFHRLVDQIGTGGNLEANGNKLSAHFGRFYPTLYKSFPEASFSFLRDGFESYIGSNWTGQLAKRNRRFSPESRASHEWISTKEAAKILRMRTAKVRELVEKGELVGRFFATSSGRQMGSILKDSVTAAAERQAKLFTLAEARRAHGLSRKRLYKLIADGLLRAIRGPLVDGYPVWQFEEAALEDAIRLAEA